MALRRIAFIHIEKCGGTTLIHMLRSSFGIRHFDIIAENASSDYISRSDLDKIVRLCHSNISIAGHSIRLFHDPEVRHYKDMIFYTILREPISRYLSDFKHFSPCFDGVHNFESWLKVQERHNFMTRAIAGEENLQKAIDLIHDKISLIGVMDLYDEFLEQLRLLFYPETLTEQYKIRNQSVNRYDGLIYGLYERLSGISKRNSIDYEIDIEKYENAIAENNKIDIKLYQYVKDVILPDQRRDYNQLKEQIKNKKKLSSFELMTNFTMNRIYRNLIYKIILGRYPIPYKMERYRKV